MGYYFTVKFPWMIVSLALASLSAASMDVWFSDVREEIGDAPQKVNIDGNLPSWLAGDLIRLGPSVLKTEKRNYTNFLDGFGRVTKWSLDGSDNQCNFQSSMIRSLQYNDSSEATIIPKHITQQPPVPPFKLGLFPVEEMDNTDVSLYSFEDDPDTFVSMTDFAAANKMDLRTLRTLGNIAYNDTEECKECQSCTFSGSHNGEWRDKADNNKQYFVNWLGKKEVNGFTLYVYLIDSSYKRKIIGKLHLSWQPYSIHSLVVAEDTVTLVLGHVSMSFVETGANLCLSCSASSQMDKKPTSIHTFKIDLESSDAKTKPIMSLELPKEDAFFVFHYLNAQLRSDAETGSEILTLDTCAYESMEGVLGDYVLGDLANTLDPTVRDTMPYNCDSLKRVQVDITNSQLLDIRDFPIVDSEGNSQYRVELASINPEYWGQSACWAYGVTYHAYASPKYDDMAVLKINMCAEEKQQTTSLFTMKETYFGEPLFVANPSGTSEDDGVLLVVSKDGRSGDSSLLVLDASQEELELVATITAPFGLMFEFHGRFLPKTSVSKRK